VTSGTATLETALFRVPQVVVYKTSSISYAIARRLIKVPFISLVNLIAEEQVVKELIQEAYNINGVAEELNRLLSDIVYKGKILQGYDQVRDIIGTDSASETTASLLVASLKR
jgi:lipid-A-disaccharide synthase